MLPDGRPVKEVTVVGHKMEVVSEFCYLGDMLSSGGDCELAATVRCRTACGKPVSYSLYPYTSIICWYPEAEFTPFVYVV